MANIKANDKTLRKSVKRRADHKGQKTELKNQIKTVKETKKVEDLNNLYGTADKLARKGTISENRARRLKSRNAKALNKK
ncbi:30S ribosomal protein S20 [[Mycoplasma] testudinis]|uniref:30S ribosomal protein S20 n=1 Tax=[Mycoplasma] testudinis TaxID=33924 RepID=UPI0004877118|nr:30S ribosomal protein S20 [[Mycoplasma] testudinis]